MPKVVIVGAGISGLAVAFRLQQQAPAVQVIVLEQRDRPGGTAWTQREGGFQVEIGPNGFLDSKSSTFDLCKELGLGDRLLPASEAAGKNRYLLVDGKLTPLPGSFGGLIRSDLLSLRGKVGFLAERCRPRRRATGDESIDAFARRRAGDEVADVFADALVTGIYAGDPKILSLAACFPRLALMESKYGSVLKGYGRQARDRRRLRASCGEKPSSAVRMWSFREGLRLLVETLGARLTKLPLLGVDVRKIQVQRGVALPRPEWAVHADGADCWTADAVVLACPAYRQAALLGDVDHGLAEQIAGIPYNRVAVVALGFRREDIPGKLDGFGFIAPQRMHRDLLGVQWCSSIFPERAPAGFVLLRAMCGGWHRADMVSWDDSRLLRAIRDELRLAQGIVAAPCFHSIIRWDRAIPQYRLGHLERVSAIETKAAVYPGLFLTGNAYHGVALNDCTEQAELVAGRVARYVASLPGVGKSGSGDGATLCGGEA